MIREFSGKKPKIHKTVYLAEGSKVIGSVAIGKDSSIWFNSVLRGDVNSISVGNNTSIQDNSVLHGTINKFSVRVGNNVTIGHNCIIHGCRIGNNCLVGMGAIVLSGAEIGDWCIIGAGAVVTEGTKIPSGSMAVGVPAKVVKKIGKEHRDMITANWKEYVELKNKHMGSV